MLISDDTAVAFTSSAAVEAAFAVAAGQHHGLIAARATVRSAERVSPGVVLADVDWEYLDAEGQAVPGTSYRYVLRMLRTGPQICVVIPHTPQQS
jgi:PIN domain nuclease of toxin-antitoxin system